MHVYLHRYVYVYIYIYVDTHIGTRMCIICIYIYIYTHRERKREKHIQHVNNTTNNNNTSSHPPATLSSFLGRNAWGQNDAVQNEYSMYNATLRMIILHKVNTVYVWPHVLSSAGMPAGHLIVGWSNNHFNNLHFRN